MRDLVCDVISHFSLSCVLGEIIVNENLYVNF